MLSSLSLTSSSPFLPPYHVHLPQPPPLVTPGQILLHHPALQLAHSPPEEAPFPFLPKTRGAAIPSSTYLRDLYKWASEAVDTIKSTGCEIPEGLGLNPGDLYLGPGSIVAIEGSVCGREGLELTSRSRPCARLSMVCVAPDDQRPHRVYLSAQPRRQPRSRRSTRRSARSGRRVTTVARMLLLGELLIMVTELTSDSVMSTMSLLEPCMVGSSSEGNPLTDRISPARH